MNNSNRYLMLGSYTLESFQELRAERTCILEELIAKMGGRLHEAYAITGSYDVAIIVDLNSTADAIKLSSLLRLRMGISITTCSAVPIRDFDKIQEDLETEIESSRMEAGE